MAIIKENHRKVAVNTVINTGETNRLFDYYSAITTVEETGLNFQLACLKDNGWRTRKDCGVGKKLTPVGWSKLQGIAAKLLLEAKGAWKDDLSQVDTTKEILKHYGKEDTGNDVFIQYCNTVLFNRIAVWKSDKKRKLIEESVAESTVNTETESTETESTETESTVDFEAILSEILTVAQSASRKDTKAMLLDKLSAVENIITELAD